MAADIVLSAAIIGSVHVWDVGRAFRFCRSIRGGSSASRSGGDARLHFADRLVDQPKSIDPMTTLVAFGNLQFASGALQEVQRIRHVRLSRYHCAAGETDRSNDNDHSDTDQTGAAKQGTFTAHVSLLKGTPDHAV